MNARTKRLDLTVAVVVLVLAGCGGSGGGRGGNPGSGFSISGTVAGAAGVTVVLTGAKGAVTTTAANGSYAFGSLANGSYAVTPSKMGYAFNPATVSLTVNGGDIAGQNFTATPSSATHYISGTISGPVADGVLVTLGGSATGTAVTAHGGVYTFPGLADGVYTLTPALSGCTFNPPSRQTTVAGLNAPSQDFTSIAPVASTPVCNAGGWCWRNPLPQGNRLSGVWGSSATDVWAVGDGGVVLRSNGTTWSGVASGTSSDLLGVWGSGPADVWAVGAGGAAQHWDGTAWTSSTATGTTQNLQGVWGSSASDVWAVGVNGIIHHWNGSAWSQATSFTWQHLYGLWGSSANDVWAVGDETGHWDGTSWTRVDVGTWFRLVHAWGAAATDVWAVGAWGTVLERGP